MTITKTKFEEIELTTNIVTDIEGIGSTVQIKQNAINGINVADISVDNQNYTIYSAPICVDNNELVIEQTISSYNLHIGTILSDHIQNIRELSGKDGASAGFGRIDATAESCEYGTQPTVQVSVDSLSPNTAKNFEFKFKIPQGPQGIQGPQGQKGDPGSSTISSITWDKVILDEDFTFSGNYIIGNKPITTENPLRIAKDTTLKHLFQELFCSTPIQYHTVSFYSDNTLCSTQSVEHNHNATPPTIHKLGYNDPTWNPEPNNITADTRCDAIWGAPIEYQITYDLNGHGIAPTKNTYNVTEEYTPPDLTESGWTFNGWTPVKINIGSTGNMTFTASWTQIPVETFTITVECDESKGSVSGNGTYNKNTTITIKALPKSGYKFKQWTKDGQQVSNESEYTFSVTETAIYYAEFEEIVIDYKYFIVTKYYSTELSNVTDENIEQHCNNHKYVIKPTKLEFDVNGDGVIALYAKKAENVTSVVIGANTLFKNISRSLNNYDCFEYHDDEAGINIEADSTIIIN